MAGFRVSSGPIIKSPRANPRLITFAAMATSPRHTFKKAEKLKSRKQIDLIFREGRSFLAPPVKCYYRPEWQPGKPEDKLEDPGIETGENAHGPGFVALLKTEIKAGFSVSKKQFKHAVDRNRVKRLMREAYRLHKHSLQTKLAEKPVTLEVFFVYIDRSLPAFGLVEEKIKYCLRRLGKMEEDKP